MHNLISPKARLILFLFLSFFFQLGQVRVVCDIPSHHTLLRTSTAPVATHSQTPLQRLLRPRQASEYILQPWNIPRYHTAHHTPPLIRHCQILEIICRSQRARTFINHQTLLYSCIIVSFLAPGHGLTSRIKVCRKLCLK